MMLLYTIFQGSNVSSEGCLFVYRIFKSSKQLCGFLEIVLLIDDSFPRVLTLSLDIRY